MQWDATMPSKHIPQEHGDAMVAAYLGGATPNAAAAPFGYSYKACIFALKQREIPLRRKGEILRRYALDDGFFDAIDTEAKAYWLGFLTADGTIRRGRVKLALQERDFTHLLKFTASLESNYPAALREEYTVSGKPVRYGQVVIISARLAQSLVSLGVGERKTFVVQPCQQAPEHLIAHYWRGVFDGDGFITPGRSRGKGALKWYIGLVGNKAMVGGFDSFVQQYVKTAAAVRPHARIFAVRYSGVSVPQAVLRLLYHGATVFLDRRRTRVDEVMATPIQRIHRGI
jgi:hypothetical protein